MDDEFIAANANKNQKQPGASTPLPLLLFAVPRCAVY
jgi:hypothetical protein